MSIPKPTQWQPMADPKNLRQSAKSAADLVASVKVEQARNPKSDRFGKLADRLSKATDFTFREMSNLADHAAGEGRDFLASERREYEDMEAALDITAPLSRQLERIGDLPEGLMAAQYGVDHDTDEYTAGRPLAKDQSFVGYVRARDLTPGLGGSAALSFDKYIRGALTGNWRGAERELEVANAMSGASSAAGGVLIPTVLSAQIVDLARPQTQVLQAGAQLVPMESRTVDIARWTQDPTFSWRTENSIVAESDGAVDKITLSAKDMGTVVRVSRDLIEDTNIADALANAFAAAFAVKIDNAALYADGTGGAPVGVKSNSGVTKTSMGANGASMTSWDNLTDAKGRLRDQNEFPNAQIMADRSARVLAKLKDTTNQPLQPPAYLDDVARLTSSSVPINLTVGTSNDCSDVFTGDWSKLVIGVRTELIIQIMVERYMTNDAAGSPAGGQYGFLAWWRGDIAILRPKAFDVITGVRG